MKNLKHLYKVGLAGYILFIFIALCFYKERTIFTDISFHLFYIVKDSDVTIQNYRFVSIFTQIFPLAGVKLGLDLSTILKLYSIAFPLFYFICYIICGSWLKDYVMALGLLCVNLLFSTDTFFWIQSELPQGLAIMMVTFSLLYKADVLTGFIYTL